MGQVAQVGGSVEDGHTLFLNFGARYPFHVFNAVVFRGNLGSFPEARSWEGKVIQARWEDSTTLTQGAVPGGAGDVVCDVADGAPGSFTRIRRCTLKDAFRIV